MAACESPSAACLDLLALMKDGSSLLLAHVRPNQRPLVRPGRLTKGIHTPVASVKACGPVEPLFKEAPILGIPELIHSNFPQTPTDLFRLQMLVLGLDL